MCMPSDVYSPTRVGFCAYDTVIYCCASLRWYVRASIDLRVSLLYGPPVIHVYVALLVFVKRSLRFQDIPVAVEKKRNLLDKSL